LAALPATLLLCPAGASAETRFTSLLTGDQQPVPVVTDAVGTATLLLNDEQTRLEIELQITGLDLDGTVTPGTGDDNVFAMHIHVLPIDIVFGLMTPNSDLNGDLTIDAANGLVTSGWDMNEGNGTTLTAQLPNLFAGNLYFNVHTSAHPDGEIRGAILLADSVPGLPLAGLVALAALLLGASRWTLSRDGVPG
jgi:hypothetical protein